MNKYISTLTLVILTAISRPSFACRFESPLTDEMKNTAESVFVGEVVSYQPRPKFDLKLPKWKPAIIEFKVEKMISGEKLPLKIELYWINGTFGESKSLKEFIKTYGKKTRVGIIHANNPVESDVFKDKPWILQGPCSSPYMAQEK